MELVDITIKDLNSRIQYLSLIGHMARIDGELAEEEITLWNDMANRFDIPELHKEKIYFDRKYSEDEVEEVFQKLRNQDLHYSFFLDLLAMALVDGVILEEERLMLLHICELIGISHQSFHNLINFSQATASIDVESPIDSMFSYVIEMFFQWASQSHVTIYKQTTLAVDPKVDKYLKEGLTN